ncbi:hypothetical protein ABW37_29955, partial [Achromobacter xylosoxidans]
PQGIDDEARAFIGGIIGWGGFRAREALVDPRGILLLQDTFTLLLAQLLAGIDGECWRCRRLWHRGAENR